MELKKYQQTTLNKIERYLLETEKFGPKHAFISVSGKTYNEDYFGPEVPFVCIKIPTGGGKTLVGCHALNLIMEKFLTEKMSKGIVMWFVSSEAIKSQTLKKFKDRKDGHRKIIDDYFENKVRIFSNEEALKISKEDVENNLCIVVSSLEAFRKEKTIQNKYKVYKENGALLGHFENVEDLKILEKDEAGVINSLANVIRLNNPLIVIDEGHKTKTELSITFLKELNPSFVIEYTATPRAGSNILVEVHSSELKDQQMVKLPLVLESHSQWQDAIIQGIAKREELEKIAKKEKEAIRPIVLLQAEQEKEDEKKITVGKIKEFLIKDRKTSEEEIAIKTSKNNELENVDLFAKNCKFRYIITVNALAEGWDCSYAYILISVANIGSKVAVEQIIGRIMRMPEAKRKDNENLNRSYVFASAKNFNEATGQIISGLENNGYSGKDLVKSGENKKYEYDAERQFKKDFSVPMMALNDEELAFEDLIGSDFKLHEQDFDFKFVTHYDSDGRAIIDIKEENKWMRGAQQILKLSYKDKNCSKAELVLWLDKKLRFTMIDREDKIKFLEKVISSIEDYSLVELSVNRYVLLSQIDTLINSVLKYYAKQKFDKLLKDKKIGLKRFEKFPEIITISEELPQQFNKSYYGKVDKLNKEELNFIERLDLDTMPNIEFWVRNREKSDFYLQGWQRNKFYPDFIALTKKGKIILLEWKGEDRISNEDTEYKTELAKTWEKLGDNKLRFFLVHNGNIEEVLKEVREL